ncbi:CD048 protein, partial [Loxia curvirostra]|nr:CD048 protein [Loxia curvirostra]
VPGKSWSFSWQALRVFLLLNCTAKLHFPAVTAMSPLSLLAGRPCVDCHAFEFMQRALQDLRKTAYSLDTRTETLLLRAEKRGLCDCFHAMH